ncbi:hypothetical protein B0O99DRAFT_628289 [Bisporella sp. PMI_857]|nr:hypothetical protein B0O99DRAFT_628289 [Bisporella sp. PMI_857]
MLVRLIPALGGDGTTYGIIAMNDTGSDMLSLYPSDIMHLGNIGFYIGWRAPVAVIDANGVAIYCPSIAVEVLPVGNGDISWRSNWIVEEAIIRNGFVPRLSGVAIRQHLYFGTAPGNHYLAVATTKGGLSSLL